MRDVSHATLANGFAKKKLRQTLSETLIPQFLASKPFAVEKLRADRALLWKFAAYVDSFVHASEQDVPDPVPALELRRGTGEEL